MNSLETLYNMEKFMSAMKPILSEIDIKESMLWGMLDNYSPYFRMTPYQWYLDSENKDDAISDIRGLLMRMYK